MVRATSRGGATFGAYEIHVGRTSTEADGQPFAVLEDGTRDGWCRERVVGTYLHGAFESAAVCEEVFGVMPPSAGPRAVDYDRLADWLEDHGRELERLGLPGLTGGRS